MIERVDYSIVIGEDRIHRCRWCDTEVRMGACVSALDGIPHPEAIKELIEAAQALQGTEIAYRDFLRRGPIAVKGIIEEILEALSKLGEIK